ncbi:unnamed protein product [Rotaria socialis]|uniref:Uncharacterized protein n=1 Tax=Rotaria socialis TaxID=392032 RepID=A0A820XAG9_9BILA|nr:unnamed protein product [Rotaria socialis]
MLFMSNLNFQRYYSNIIIPNKHRIISLALSNLFIIDNILSSAHSVSSFSRLEILILDNIAAKHLENILNYVLSLSKLCSLTIHAVDSVENSNYFYRKIFKLPVLKYCKVSFATNSNIESLSMSNNEYSPIEDLIIENTVNFDALDRLVSYPVQFLRISTEDDIEYLDGNRWEQLILSYMAHLRVFHMNHSNSILCNDRIPLSFDILVKQFTSSFWIERQCSFTHQNDWIGSITIEICFQWIHIKINFNSVNHIHICYTQALNNCVNYFPNVTDLTLDDKFDTSITTSLNRIISLSRITKLSNH